MNINIIKRYFLEIIVKTILPIGLGFAIAGYISQLGIPLTGFKKAFTDSFEVGLIVTGLLNFLSLFSFIKIRDKDEYKDSFLSFVTNNCIHQNCWGGVIACNSLKESKKTITIAHPTRKTLSSDAPILETYNEIDIIGFGQSRLREPFHSGEIKRKELISRLSTEELKIRVLAPIVKEDYFKYSDDNPIATNQNKFEGIQNEDERVKIKDLVDWYMGIGKELVEHLLKGNREDQINLRIIENAIDIKLHNKPLIPFYMRVKNKTEHSIHIGPYLPGKRSSETITFEMNDINKFNDDTKSNNFNQLTHYFDNIWQEIESRGTKILLEYYQTSKKNTEKKLSKQHIWDKALEIISP